MSSSSFGTWYETQKNANQTKPSSWSNNFWKGSSDTDDVESTGLLSKVKSMKTTISNAGNTMKEVMALFGLALVFFAIAYFIGLPTLLVRPAKFSISFMMGSFMTIAALARLQGYNAFLNSVTHPDRIWKTILYLVSLLFSILCAVVWKSYFGTVVSSLLQVFAILALIIRFVYLFTMY